MELSSLTKTVPPLAEGLRQHENKNPIESLSHDIFPHGGAKGVRLVVHSCKPGRSEGEPGRARTREAALAAARQLDSHLLVIEGSKVAA